MLALSKYPLAFNSNCFCLLLLSIKLLQEARDKQTVSTAKQVGKFSISKIMTCLETNVRSKIA